MAISQMKKLSLIFGKDYLDQVLQVLQKSHLLEVRNLSQLEDWQEAFSEKKVSLPQIISHINDSEKGLVGQEVFQNLLLEQEKLENGIAKLSEFIPKAGKLANLKKADVSLSFDDFTMAARQADARAILKDLEEKIRCFKSLEAQLENLQEEGQQLEKWKNLSHLPQDFANYKFISVLIGTIPSTTDDAYYQKLKKDPNISYEEIFHTETEYGLMLFWDKKKEISLEDYHFKLFDYQYDSLPSLMIKTNQDRIADKTSQRDNLKNQLQVSQALLEKLQIETDYVLSEYLRQKAKEKLASTDHLVALEAWIESRNLGKLRQILDREFGDKLYLLESDVDQKDWEDVPIKLHNHPLIEPFELVTEMYALPKYYEKDPTPILAPFYFTFFGMMVADLGYGLILFLSTFLALRYFNLKTSSKRFIKFFNILGVAVSLWGLIYGSFLGFNLPVALLSTQTDIMTILILSVLFGFVTVIVGLLLGGLQHLKMKDYAEAYNSGFSWSLILVGILMLALGMTLPGFGILVTIGKWLAILNAIGILVVSLVKAKSLAGLGSGLYNLYNISGYVGDLVSFTRLMALGLSGASIGSAFNLIVGIFPPIGRFSIGILLFILLHVINIFLSLLSGYVHGARLIFVEFFGKFYQGGGKAFQPLKLAEKYVKIHSETQLEEK
ncbi:V-type ATP synthase subunit I [Streptococcus didelphis]|uniref:V-type ATP synthase subunit I n=1 Tax=Streptococcus didelphis TaxID=102886 RepID=UPI000382CECC|nr:V-type ATP synthase subunit I [Streptococcus didelphis]